MWWVRTKRFIEIDADIYVIIDGGGTYSGKDARILTDLMISKRVDMVIGDRLSTGAYSRQNKRLGHLLGNSIMTKIISALSGRNYHDVFSGLRVMSRPFVQALEVRSPGFQLETELNVLAAYLKVSVWEVPIDYDARPLNSSSKLSTVKDGTKILSFALRYCLLFAPLLLFSIIAFITGMVGVALSCRIIHGFIQTGWPYSTTAVAPFLVSNDVIAIFGIALELLVNNSRRREIANFLETKALEQNIRW